MSRARYRRHRIGRGGIPLVRDSFNRADSTTSLGSAETGQAWTAHAGTWGIASNEAYSATDADLDVATIDTGTGNGTFRISTKGPFDAVSRSVHFLVFRGTDADTYLLAGVEVGGGLKLFKRDVGLTELAAAATSGATSDAYFHLSARCSEDSIEILVDGVVRITHTLAGADATTFGAATTRAGVHLAKSGAPLTAARTDWLQVTA